MYALRGGNVSDDGTREQWQGSTAAARTVKHTSHQVQLTYVTLVCTSVMGSPSNSCNSNKQT